jgi:hypothetical protein
MDLEQWSNFFHPLCLMLMYHNVGPAGGKWSKSHTFQNGEAKNRLTYTVIQRGRGQPLKECQCPNISVQQNELPLTERTMTIREQQDSMTLFQVVCKVLFLDFSFIISFRISESQGIMCKLEALEQQISSTQTQMDVIRSEEFRIGGLVQSFPAANCNMHDFSDTQRSTQLQTMTRRLDNKEDQKVSATGIVESRAQSEKISFRQSLASIKKSTDASNTSESVVERSCQSQPGLNSKPKLSCVAKKPSTSEFFIAVFGIRPAAPRLAVTGSRAIHPTSRFNVIVSSIMLLFLTYSALVIPMELAATFPPSAATLSSTSSSS